MASAQPTCQGKHRPTLTVTCPAKLVFGQPSTFTATGADLDGETLTYTWTINDVVQAGKTGSTAELTIQNGQRVGVIVTDPTGLVGRPDKAVFCKGDLPNITTGGTTAGTTTGGTTSGTTGGSTSGTSGGTTSGTTGGSTSGTSGGTTSGTTGGSTSGGTSILGSTQTKTASTNLPKTGINMIPLIGAAISLIGIGAVLIAEMARRRSVARG